LLEIQSVGIFPHILLQISKIPVCFP
jgi:hypothetical protein